MIADGGTRRESFFFQLLFYRFESAMAWEAASAEHTGGRSRQEDRVAAWTRPQEDGLLAMVADGMGGYEDGSLAARMVVDAAGDLWKASDDLPPRRFLFAVIESAHEAIRAADAKGRPHTTCVLLCARKNRAAWAHVGDSRLYHFRSGTLVTRTRDHSVVQMLVDMERLSEEDVAGHPDQGALLQSLGGSRKPEPDYGEALLQGGDAFLLCSDGLWTHCSTREMAEALSLASLEEAARCLVHGAARRGGEKGDNISLALARWEP